MGSVFEPDNHSVRGIRLLPVLALLGFGFAAFVLIDEQTDEAPAAAASDASSEPDLMLSVAEILSFRESGGLKYLLRSPHIERFDNEDRTTLLSPDLEMHSPPDPPWRMTAEHGTISNGPDSEPEERVFLERDVRMSQQFEDGRAFELRTPSITIYPDREYAETDQDVIITTHAGRTRAVGLQGNLDQGLLQLSSNDQQRVHTILLPDQFK